MIYIITSDILAVRAGWILGQIGDIGTVLLDKTKQDQQISSAAFEQWWLSSVKAE